MPEPTPRLLEALSSGATIVAATPRLAREIKRNFALHQSGRGTTAWHDANVRSWDEWLRELGEQVLWSGYSAPAGRRRLLTPLQERVLWERTILAAREQRVPINVSATAGLAREAWILLQHWRLPDPGSVGFSTAEQQAFSGWMREYHQQCNERGWLDTARVIDSLVPAIGSGAVPVPERVVLTGFDSFNPQQRGLLRVLTSMGSRLGLIRRDPVDSEARRVALGSADEEMRHAVRWLRGLVAANGTTRAGLVIPNLDEACTDIERMLDEAMLPGYSLPGGATGLARPYEIASGRPLRKQPVVVAADHLLALSMGTVSMRVLSRIVRSPFLRGGIGEAARRARFDSWLRAQGSVDIDLEHLPAMLEAFRHSTGLASEEFDFEQQVRALVSARQPGGEILMPSAWSASFRDLLGLFGWPGDGQLDAVQAQALQNFDDLLREFASLDGVSGALHSTAALRLLRQLLRQRQFGFEADNAPILVLGAQDAAWLSFDHLWIAASAQSGWSGAAMAPNPFIPVEWQHECKLPESGSQARATYRHELASRLLRAASQIVVSHTDDDPVHLHAVFAALPEVSPSDIDMAELTDYRLALVASTEIETIEDRTGPPLEPVESLDLDEHVLRLQAECPFRAFALRRLSAHSPKPLRPGLLPESRVVLVRIALEHLWHRIESSEVLQAALAGEHLEVQIWEVADTVLAVFERKLPMHLSRRYRALEHARLVRLLMQWLRVETQRCAFSVVRTDVNASVDLAGVAFRAHVDRIDHVGTSGTACIDYSTTPFDPHRWLGDRPDAPELILYALAADEAPDALLVGCVTTDRLSLSGVQHDIEVVSGLPGFEDSELARISGLGWDELLEHWRETLTTLGREFAAGDSAVTPKYGKATCAQCNLSSLCRIGESVRA